MKCEHCGKNEVTFMYRSSVNGNVTEQHLCGECAEKLGYTRAMAARNRSMVQSFFGRNSLFDDFFSPVSGLMGRSRWLLEDPFDDFFSEMPALRSTARQEQEAAPQLHGHLTLLHAAVSPTVAASGFHLAVTAQWARTRREASGTRL